MKILAILSLGALALPVSAAVIMEQPVRYYRSASDSPYFPLFVSGDAFLFDFEGDEGFYYRDNAEALHWHDYEAAGQQNPRDFTFEFARLYQTGSPTFGSENASVDDDDGEDGFFRGFDRDGHGLIGDGFDNTPSVDLVFRTLQHEAYPLWVGFVMTTTGLGGGIETPAPQVDLLGLGGNVIGSFSLFDVRADMVADSLPGQPAHDYRVFNDRLVVFHSEEPITRIKIYNAVVFDHIQWGYTPVPEPGSVALAFLAGAILLRRRRAA